MSQADFSPWPVRSHQAPGAVLTPQPSAAPTAASAASPAVTPPDALPQQGNGLWEALFENLDYNFDAVYTVIDAILTAKDRCQVTPLYIQGVVTPSATFLASNVGQSSRLQLTTVDTCWRMGRATDCALYIPHPAVDSCHAAIHYTAETGFRLTDLGSTTGLRHNRHRLPSLSRRHLRNGDLIELGTLRIEFFIDDFNTACTSDAESTTYF